MEGGIFVPRCIDNTKLTGGEGRHCHKLVIVHVPYWGSRADLIFQSKLPL